MSRINNIIFSYFNFYDKINLQKIKEEANKIHKEKNWSMFNDIFCKRLKINKKDFNKAIFLLIKEELEKSIVI